MTRRPVLLSIVLILGGLVHAQAPSGVPPARTEPAGLASPQAPESRSAADQLRPNYVLHPGDQVLIRAAGIPDVSEKPFLIDGDGFVELPTLGRVKAGGLTVSQLEELLVKLSREYVREPQVTVTVVQFSSEPVFFVGAFKTPGIYPLNGRRTLIEMMAAVGGLLPNASRRIKLTRRKESGEIPLSSAVSAPDGSSSSVEINMAKLRDNLNPAEDIVLQPFDVISVERSELVYVSGEVLKVGALELQERDSMSVLQALTQAGGLGPAANPKMAFILRPVLNTSRRAEIPLNLKRILSSEDSDVPLLPNDVLYVPKSSAIKGRDLLYALPIGATLLTAISYLILR
jgi:polysaccharide export outer membrane protein